VVLLGGESGIGKSRLVHVLTERISGEPQVRIECRGSPYYQHTAFYPVTELLERLLWWQQVDTPESKLRKLEAALAQSALPLQETVPLLAALLSLPLPEGHYPSLPVSPQRQREKTLHTILALWLELAQQQPVLLIVDDLQWIDPSSLELLGLLVDQAPMVRSLILLTFRSTFVPPWSNRSYVLHFTLPRLSPSQVHAMIAGMTGGKELPDQVLRHLVSTTDGVPLFVEEMTKAVLESELLKEQAGSYDLTEALPTPDIPATLQDSLRARLDHLSTFKGVAQLGATLGRTFSYELLRAVSPLDETTLQQGLRRLMDAELLYQRGVPPQAVYFFKHALIQEAAYQSLLRGIRQQYHQRIAYVLSTRFPDSVATQPELLAHHYTEAGLLPSAVDYWQRAGQRAIERSAHPEAISHLTKGLELLKMLPETPQSAHQELSLQINLGPALRATKGYAAPDVERAYARARELCQHVGETAQLFPVLWGLLLFYLVRAELQTAYTLAQQLFGLSQRQHDPDLLLEAHIALGMTLFQLGELASAREHLEHGMALYNPQQHRTHAFLYGQDPGVFCLSYGSWVLWFLGYPDQALERVRTALTLAREGSHPYSLVFALTFAARIYQCRRDVQVVQTLAEEIIKLSTEQGFAYYLIQGMIQRGWALAQQGHSAEGLEHIRQGLTTLGGTGTELGRPGFLIQLAEGYASVGQTEAGLSTLLEALSLVEKNGICCWEAELYRLKGEFLLALSGEHAVEAESCMCQALAIAHRQQARSWELRAAMSLGRLWRDQGKSTDALRLLSAAYQWFTEGRDTIDLKDAKNLLDTWV
jgi:predicted ATPase